MAAPMCRGMRRLHGKTILNSLFCQRPYLTALGHKYMRTFADFNKSKYSRKFTIATVSVSLASVFVVSCLQKTDTDKASESRNKESKNEVQETETTQSIISKHKITRNVKGVTDLKGYKITLYQFQSCPFCCKVRAALDFYGFSYDVIEVNSINKAQLKWSDYKKVPVMLLERTTGNDYLKVVDSTQITSVLGSYMLNPDQPVEQLVNSYPAILDTEKKKKTYYFPNKYFLMFGENKNDNCTVKEKRQEDKWRRWVDETFIHVISPTVYNTYAEARETFKHFSKVGEWNKHFSDVQRYTMIEVGSIAMYFVARMLKKKHNIKENPMDSMSDACQQWLRGLGKQKYMGGNQPNLADLAMYGGLHSFKGCKAFREIMEMSKLQKWYNRMESDIAYHRGIEIAAWRATDKVDQ